MRAGSRVLLGLVTIALIGFGFLADRALVVQAQAAAREEQVDRAERGRLAAVALRAAIGGIEEQLLAGALPPGIMTSHAVTGPAPAGNTGSYSSRPQADLETLLDSLALTGNGLPEAVVAAVALGTPGARAYVAARLLAGRLPVRVGDLPHLAGALDAGSDARIATLTSRLERRPAQPPPLAPAFLRARAANGLIEAWTRTPAGLLMYEVPADALIAIGGVGERVMTVSMYEADNGAAVPDVEDLAVVVAPDAWAHARVSSMRAALWIAIVIALGGVISIVRGVERESQTVAREKAILANITHELRSPLASIRVLAETLAQGRGNPLEYGALIAEEGQRLEGLVEQALTSARIDEAPSFAPVDPGEIVTSAVALIRARAARRSVSIASDIASVPEACWDGPAVRRALLNLLDNAVTHGRQGGLVRVSLTETGGVLRLSVADDGPGIGRRDRRRVFDRFVRGASDGPGTGLGLYVVERVARAHGGRVDLVCAEQRGCTFTLVLPLGGGVKSDQAALVGSMADGRL